MNADFDLEDFEKRQDAIRSSAVDTKINKEFFMTKRRTKRLPINIKIRISKYYLGPEIGYCPMSHKDVSKEKKKELRFIIRNETLNVSSMAEKNQKSSIEVEA